MEIVRRAKKLRFKKSKINTILTLLYGSNGIAYKGICLRPSRFQWRILFTHLLHHLLSRIARVRPEYISE